MEPTTAVMAKALAILIHLSPIGQKHEVFPGWTEAPEARLDRYYAIAADVSAAALDYCRGSVPCAKDGVTTLLGVAWHESGFAPDVDAGRCYRGKDGKSPRCDGGNAHSMWQLHVTCSMRDGAPPCTQAATYDTDRRAAAREAIARLVRSRMACSRNPNRAERLADYAGGACTLPMAIKRSIELDACIQKAAKAPPLPEGFAPAPRTIVAPGGQEVVQVEPEMEARRAP